MSSSAKVGQGHTIVEFIYHSPDIGEVTVEAYFWVTPPDPNNTSSDWDYYGGAVLDNVYCYQQHKMVTIDIPTDLVYAELRDYLRNIDICVAFDEEINLCN